MIEYKVRPVTRWEITRYESSESGSSCGPVCEVRSMAAAENIGGCLAEKDGGTFHSYGPNTLADIPELLRRIAGQVEDGTHPVSTGVLTLRANGQRRPMVFGFGVVCDPKKEFEFAAKELARLGHMKPPKA